MELDDTLTDETVLSELGQRLARQRLDAGLSQAMLAEQAGIAKRTLERLEAGDSSQLVTLIRVLRVLGRVAAFDALLPADQAGPMALLHGKGNLPQRVRRNSKTEPSESWQWDDET